MDLACQLVYMSCQLPRGRCFSITGCVCCLLALKVATFGLLASKRFEGEFCAALVKAPWLLLAWDAAASASKLLLLICERQKHLQLRIQTGSKSDGLATSGTCA